MTNKIKTYLMGGAAGALAYMALSYLFPEQTTDAYLGSFSILGTFFASCSGGVSFSLLEDIINKTK